MSYITQAAAPSTGAPSMADYKDLRLLFFPVSEGEIVKPYPITNKTV